MSRGWLASVPLLFEKDFKRVKGFRDIDKVVATIEFIFSENGWVRIFINMSGIKLQISNYRLENSIVPWYNPPHEAGYLL
jgi:hypothetical protein